MSLIVVVEGRTDEPVVRKLATDAGLAVADVLPMRGKGKLDRGLQGFNAAADGSPWFVLRDLDHDAACAPTYLEGLLFCFKWLNGWCSGSQYGSSNRGSWRTAKASPST